MKKPVTSGCLTLRISSGFRVLTIRPCSSITGYGSAAALDIPHACRKPFDVPGNPARWISRLYGGDPSRFWQDLAIETPIGYHGMANGHFTGDECIGVTVRCREPSFAVWLRRWYSYEQLLSISGDPYWGDRLGAAGVQCSSCNH